MSRRHFVGTAAAALGAVGSTVLAQSATPRSGKAPVKVITYFRARRSPAEFQQWYLHDYAPRLLASVAGVSRYVANLVEPTPENAPFRPTSELAVTDGRPAYDVVSEAWCDDAVAHRAALDQLTLASRLDDWLERQDAYAALELIERNNQPAHPEGSRSPGLKYMGRLQLHADLPDAAARRIWDHHVQLALKVHVGANKYVRNWVTAPLSPGARDTRGVSELHFPTLDDLLTRFFDSDRGREEILHDVAHFVAAANRLYLGEYVLRS